jgi:hypothetical protein
LFAESLKIGEILFVFEKYVLNLCDLKHYMSTNLHIASLDILSASTQVAVSAVSFSIRTRNFYRA